MKFIEVTHANNGQIVYLPVALIFAFYYSEGHKCTLITASGGAMVPVKETVDEIKAKMLG
jgi:hypothetical protein